MKKTVVFVLLILSLNTAWAQDWRCYECLDPVECIWRGIHFQGFFDYLYWKVCQTDLDYSDLSENTHYLNPNYHSGWRVGFKAIQGNLDAGARYTHYFYHKTVYPGGDDFPANSRVAFDTEWQIADFEIGYTFSYWSENLLIRPFAGAKLGIIDETFEKELELDIKNDSHLKGCGLYTGFEGTLFLFQGNFCGYCIPGVLKCRLSGAVLDSRIRQDSCREKQCLYIPVYEALGGLEIGGRPFWGARPYLFAGYEVQSWLNKRIDSFDKTAWLGIGGLVLRLTLDY